MLKEIRTRRGALNETLQTLGQCLKNMRLAVGMTQDEASEMLGVSSQAIRNWESGRHEPTLDHLHCMEKLYGVGLEEVLYITPKSNILIPVRIGRVRLINEFLPAGSSHHSNSIIEEGSLPIPEFILEQQPHVFGLTVRGDSLSPIGINDGDILFVDPDAPLEEMDIRILRFHDRLYARTVEIQEGLIRLRRTSEDQEELSFDQVQDMGKVIWYLKRL